MIRRALPGLTALAVLTALTSCASHVHGEGASASVASSPSPSGSTSSVASSTPTSAPSSAAPDPLVRKATMNSLGDVATIDLCAPMKTANLAKYGHATISGYQTAGACFIDVSGRSDYFEISVVEGGIQGSTTGTSEERSFPSGAVEFGVPAVKDDCERELDSADLQFDVNTDDVEDASSKTLCGAVEVVVARLAAALAAKQVPRRSVATPSLLRFDLCQLLISSTPRDLSSEFVGANLGDQCDAHGSDTSWMYVRYNFVADGYHLAGERGGTTAHLLVVDPYDKGAKCEVLSEQGATKTAGHEYLDVIVDSSTVHATKRPCEIATSAMTDMLDKAGLH